MASDLAKAGRSILLLGALCWDVSVLIGILWRALPGSARPWLCWEGILLAGAPLLSASRIQTRMCTTLHGCGCNTRCRSLASHGSLMLLMVCAATTPHPLPQAAPAWARRPLFGS